MGEASGDLAVETSGFFPYSSAGVPSYAGLPPAYCELRRASRRPRQRSVPRVAVVAGREDRGQAPDASIRSDPPAVGVVHGPFQPVEQADGGPLVVDVLELHVALLEHRAAVVGVDQYAGHHSSFPGGWEPARDGAVAPAGGLYGERIGTQLAVRA